MRLLQTSDLLVALFEAVLHSTCLLMYIDLGLVRGPCLDARSLRPTRL